MGIISFSRRQLLRGVGRITSPLAKPLRGGWCWIQDPRAIHYQGDYNRTYFGWCDNNASGRIMAGLLDHETGEVAQVMVSPHHQHDDHSAPALLMVEGRLWVFWSGHNSGGLRLRKCRDPESIASWEKERGITTERAVTYPTPIMVNGGRHHRRIYVFFRDSLHPSGKGRPIRMTWCDYPYKESGWAPAVVLIHPNAHGEALSETYVKIEASGESIHVACSSDNHNEWPSYRDIYWFCSEDGGETWKTHSSILELPISLNSMEPVFKSGESNSWIWDLALDGRGFPRIAFAHNLSQPGNHEYRSVGWDGSGWIDAKICDSGRGGLCDGQPFYSGGISLDHDDPETCFCSVAPKPDGCLEIGEYRYLTAERRWDPVRYLTSESGADNLRPVVPRGSRPPCRVIWMKGEYRAYTDYPTDLTWGV